jgi:hypothetical protein
VGYLGGMKVLVFRNNNPVEDGRGGLVIYLAGEDDHGVFMALHAKARWVPKGEILNWQRAREWRGVRSRASAGD